MAGAGTMQIEIDTAPMVEGLRKAAAVYQQLSAVLNAAAAELEIEPDSTTPTEAG